MITIIGKSFVLTTFVLSILFLAVAIGLYANHMPWHTQEQKPGIVEKLKKQIEDHAYSEARARDVYQGNYNLLGASEVKRVSRQRFYQEKYELVKSGKDPQGQVVNPAVFELEFIPVDSSGQQL